MGLNYAVNGPMSVTDCYFSLLPQIYIKKASSQDITVPAAAHLRPVLIICTVNIRMVPSQIKLSYPAGLQAITAAKQRNTCVSRLPDMLMHFSRSITQHYIAGNPYSWRRSSLQSTLYEASIAMRGMSTVALQLPGLMGLEARGSQKRHVRSLQWEREKEPEKEWARKREKEKRKKVSLHHRTALTEISVRSHRVNHHLDHKQDQSERMERKRDERKEGNMPGMNECRRAWGKEWCTCLKSMYINISYFLHWDCTGEIVKSSKEPQNKDGFPGWGTKRRAEPSSFYVFHGIFIGFLTCLRSGKSRERNPSTPWAAFKSLWDLKKLKMYGRSWIKTPMVAAILFGDFLPYS